MDPSRCISSQQNVRHGFTLGIDFSTKMSESTGGRPAADHLLTIEMAFVDEDEDCALLLNRQDDFARAIARGITDFAQ